MGFNEFCASAYNSKKRPRQTIHLASTGRSLKEVFFLMSVRAFLSLATFSASDLRTCHRFLCMCLVSFSTLSAPPPSHRFSLRSSIFLVPDLYGLCMFMYVCIHIGIYTCVHTCIYANICIHLYIYTQYTYLYIYICICICMCMCLCICVCVCIYMYI